MEGNKKLKEMLDDIKKKSLKEMLDDITKKSPARWSFRQAYEGPNSEERLAAEKDAMIFVTLLRGLDFVENVYFSGSFARGTAVGPEIGDIDIIAIVKSDWHKRQVDARRSMLESLTKQCDESAKQPERGHRFVILGGSGATFRLQDTSIGVLFQKKTSSSSEWKTRRTFDIVPAKSRKDGKIVVERRRSESAHYSDEWKMWDQTRKCNMLRFPRFPDLGKYHEAVYWSGDFLKVVRALKYLNAEAEKSSGSRKPFKSFHLELLCCQFASDIKGQSLVKACEIIISGLANHSSKRLAVKVPGFEDTYVKLPEENDKLACVVRLSLEFDKVK